MATKYQPGTRVSEYLLESVLGVGSFGEVWRARHHVWEGERVAVKLPTQPEYVRYLQREGVVVHGLRHPNIVRVLGLDPYADVPYLVMELVDGPSLASVLQEHPKGLPIRLVLRVLRGVLTGLAEAHRNNIVHRDLKPGNVLLNLGGKPLTNLMPEDVKLSDFGLGARNADALQSIVQSASLDRDNKLVGTLAYLAPELRDGARQADPRTDLFSLGVMLFEMITGERPAGAELPSTVRPDCSEALDEVFRLLYSRYDRRYASAQAVLDDLSKRFADVVAAPPLRHAPDRHGQLPPLPGTGETVFVYRALDDDGEVVGGEIFARTCEEAEHRIRMDRGLEPLHVATRVSVPGITGPSRPDCGGILGPGAADARRIGVVPPPIPQPCPACRRPANADDQFCTSCGRQLVSVVRRCPTCRAYPGPRDTFCIACGTRLEGVWPGVR